MSMAKKSANTRSTKKKKSARTGRTGTTRKSGGTSRKTPPAPDATGKHLVIVESPAKARTINRYLGDDYVVMASVGHVRDLPSRAPKVTTQEIPGVDI